jgi:DNA-binding transcriptional MerR regulator
MTETLAGNALATTTGTTEPAAATAPTRIGGSVTAGLSIEATAARTGITPHTLRYYERIGLLPPVSRAASGHRRYSDDDIGWVVFLTLLRETGMSIRDMQRFVNLTRAGDETIAERVEVLKEHRTDLLDTLERLHQHLDALDHKIGIYQEILRTQASVASDDQKEIEHA